MGWRPRPESETLSQTSQENKTREKRKQSVENLFGLSWQRRLFLPWKASAFAVLGRETEIQVLACSPQSQEHGGRSRITGLSLKWPHPEEQTEEGKGGPPY